MSKKKQSGKEKSSEMTYCKEKDLRPLSGDQRRGDTGKSKRKEKRKRKEDNEPKANRGCKVKRWIKSKQVKEGQPMEEQGPRKQDKSEKETGSSDEMATEKSNGRGAAHVWDKLAH